VDHLVGSRGRGIVFKDFCAHDRHLRRVSKSGVAIGSAIGAVLAGTLSGCVKSKGELVVDDSVGVTALRDPCPRVAIPEYAGDDVVLRPKRTDRVRST
jgi:hypothetical protein